MQKKTKVAIGISVGAIVLIGALIAVFIRDMSPPPRMVAPSGKTKVPPVMAPRPPRMALSPKTKGSPVMAPRQPRMAPSPKTDPLQAIDRVLEKMDFGNIAFNAPKTMNLHDSALIHLVLGVEKEIEDIKKMIEEEGERVGASIRVSNRMEARLSGRNFEITAINPEVQAVARREVTEWKWEIKPRADGRQNLHLTLSALLSVEGESTPRVIRTFDRIIIVEVTIVQKTKVFMQNNWQWLWTVVLVPLAGWAWKRRKRRLLRAGNNNRES